MKISLQIKGLNYESREVKGIVDELNFMVECESSETIEAIKMLKETIIEKLTKNEEK